MSPNRHEQLAQWYLRLNGFLTMDNFVLHDPDGTSLQRTDIDVMGVRFRHHAEVVDGRVLEDDARFLADGNRNRLLLAEVTSGRCKLNKSTRDPKRHNLDHALRAVGALLDADIPSVAVALYRDGVWKSRDWLVGLACFGSEPNARLDPANEDRFRKVEQIAWPEVLRFVFRRYKGRWRKKSQHQQWPDIGRLLGKGEDAELFVSNTIGWLEGS